MKKKTNLQAASDEDEAKPRKHGPDKEKIQITLRIDADLANEAYAQMKSDNSRITDVVERGIQLALQESRHELPAWTKQVRFMVANTTRAQQELIRGLLIAMVEPEVLNLRREALLDVELKFFEMCAWYLTSKNTMPHADACLEWYSRYGKSPREVAKLEKRVSRRRRLQVS